MEQPNVRRNLKIYGWLKVFHKRVYLPLTTIYLVEVGHLSLAQIGSLVAVGAFTSIASDVPTGYFADRVKRKTSLVTGAILLAIAATIFVIGPNYAGAILAIAVEACGFAFINGAGEALMHDTLLALGQVDQYVKVMGRTQSFGLVGNVVLVGLIPLTYGIDKRLPFAFGAAAALTLCAFSAALFEPPRSKPAHLTGNVYSGLLTAIRTFINRHSIWIFISIGLLSAFYVVYGQFVTLVYKNLGINVSLIGLIYSASSLVGAIGGLYVHRIRKLPLLAYSLFDVFMACFTMVIIGLTHNLWVAIVIGLLNMGFWRLRLIIYQDHLFRHFGQGGSKATLISALGFFDDINELWLPVLFVSATTSYGFFTGFALLGSWAFGAIGVLMIIGASALERLPIAKSI